MLLFTKEYQARAFSRPAVSNKDSTDTEGSGGPLVEQHTIPAIVEITVGGEGDSPYAVLMIKSGSKEHAGRYHVKCMNGNVTMRDVKEAIGRTTSVKPQYMRLLAKGRQVPDESTIEEVAGPQSTLEMMMLFKYGYHMQVEGSVWLKQRQDEMSSLKAKLDRMENSLNHRGGDLAEFLMQLTKVGEVVGSYLESVDHVTVNESLLPEMKRLKEDLLAADEKVKELNSRVPLI
ncbi:hypothetical protein FOZ62_029105 [Perkinsus olseni]|uniref:Ubiquitin-like domain-containing protein n=1 Tax=Perkinsus olseni TaxID=32597 RepID=A0A7J6R8W0_PEROL|nr:hypothetical protein FOZ62_029105 [Perkinsus olseni]